MTPIWLLPVGLVLLAAGESQAFDWESRLAGGANATKHAYYIARIQPMGPKDETKWICNGAIINTTLILTTASCMYGALSASVTAGAPEPEAASAADGAQFTNVTQIYYHPKFSQNKWENDIAILRVDPPFNTTDMVDVIALPKSSAVKGDKLANKTTVWVSYGMVNSTTNTTGLQMAMIKPIKQKACDAIYNPGYYFVKVPKDVMCIEVTTTTGMCLGDKGSPLMTVDPKDKKNPTLPLLVALAARNPDSHCPPNETLSNNTPDWFTRVHEHYKWIAAMGGPAQK